MAKVLQTKQVAAKAVNPIDAISRAGVINIEADNIDWVQRAGGGGRGASPENQAVRDKADSLKIGQGFVLPKGMVVKREIKNASTGAVSTLYTFKGANLVHKLQGKKFRTKRDTSGNLYLFRVTPTVLHVEGEQAEAEE
jgi:hypothetical protein